jgi:hypothetical protein
VQGFFDGLGEHRFGMKNVLFIPMAEDGGKYLQNIRSDRELEGGILPFPLVHYLIAQRIYVNILKVAAAKKLLR